MSHEEKSKLSKEDADKILLKKLEKMVNKSYKISVYDEVIKSIFDDILAIELAFEKNVLKFKFNSNDTIDSSWEGKMKNIKDKLVKLKTIDSMLMGIGLSYHREEIMNDYIKQQFQNNKVK